MEITLLPCPFCGHDAKFITSKVGLLYNVKDNDIACGTFGCFMEHGGGWNSNNKDELAEMWNRRVDNG